MPTTQVRITTARDTVELRVLTEGEAWLSAGGTAACTDPFTACSWWVYLMGRMTLSLPALRRVASQPHMTVLRKEAHLTIGESLV